MDGPSGSLDQLEAASVDATNSIRVEYLRSDPRTWDHETLVAEVHRLRSIIGFDERTYADLKQALLASRDHTMGLSAQFGELRAKASWFDEAKPKTDRHIRNLERHIANLERRLEETIEWANNVNDHSTAVQEWAEGVEAFNRNVAEHYGEIVAKASSYDALMRRPVMRVAAGVARRVRRRGRVQS